MMTVTDSPVLHPEPPSPSKSRFGLILALSALAHVLVFIVLPRQFWSPDSAGQDAGDAIRIEIVQPKPEPQPVAQAPEKTQPEPQQQTHLPRHNADETDLRGTDFESPVEAQVQAGVEPEAQPKVAAEDKHKTELAEGQPSAKVEPAAKPEVTSESATETVAERKTEPEKPQGMKDLSDRELAGANAGSPASELEKRRIQMVNQFLARMQSQVDRRFRKPLNARSYQEGEIAFELDPSGYLLSARIIESSGNVLLDASALEAIRSVPRFSVPDSPIVAARYYRNLTFRYTGE
ncbi:cell envelope integrity protein TolA [Marinobacter fonticola]|uniref:cell envelope integrity protein TolA n=1 Tax=Marinobacter fonticola TaxID=2603215 RepID=UPI0011E8A0FE|nr:TonB family protein [Marinobacter fonticola]